jgi:hypothetical protein
MTNSIEKWVENSREWEQIDLSTTSINDVYPPVPRNAAGAIMINDKDALIFGGEINGKYTNECYIYDTESNKWVEAKDLPRAAFVNSGSPIKLENKVYAYCSDKSIASDYTHEQFIYDISQMCWALNTENNFNAA